MNERTAEELTLLRTVYPGLEWHPESRWVRIHSYILPRGVWRQTEVELAVQLPEQLPGQQPYGFWVRPRLELADGQAPANYTYPAPIPLGDDWGQFSWSLSSWTPHAQIAAGSNMLNFVRSIAGRLREGV